MLGLENNFLSLTDKVREDIGRLLIVGFEGCDFSEIERLIVEIRPAGLIFFKRNYPGSPEKLRSLLDAAQDLAKKILSRRLFTAIDHEGGLVQRLPSPYTQLPSASEVGRDKGGQFYARSIASRGAQELAATGFNFNMAPVLDVAPEGGGFIGSRSFSSDPEAIANLGLAYLSAFHAAGILGAAKHFPGLGEAVIDPHHELPLMDVSLERLEKTDLLPFQRLLSKGLVALMSTHALYPALDKDSPATFSSRIINLIKNKSSFAGAVLSDDLEMGAVVKNYPMGEAAVSALIAGHDLLLICRRRSYIDECVWALANSIENGRLTHNRLRDAHRRSTGLMSKIERIKPSENQREEWFAKLCS